MYDDYMQNLWGIQVSPYQNTYEENMGYMPYGNWQEPVQMPYGFYQRNMTQQVEEVDVESMYPDIYKIVYPMVKKACSQNTKPITKEVIDEMAQDIYSNIEADNIINLNINVENSNISNNRGTENMQHKQEENRCVENRQARRGPIFDLVKILLIRELLDRRPGNRPRPPRPPMPPKPGFPGRPPRPGNWDDDFYGRPPMPRY